MTDCGVRIRATRLKTSRRHIRCLTRTATVVFGVAVALNFLWEMGQSRLFAPMGSVLEGTWRCFRASLVDGLIVLLLFSTGWVLFGRRLWIVQSGPVGYAFIVTAGVMIGAGIEWFAIRAGAWTYRTLMPLLPGLKIGVVPVLQMAVLPALALRIAAAWQLHRR